MQLVAYIGYRDFSPWQGLNLHYLQTLPLTPSFIQQYKHFTFVNNFNSANSFCYWQRIYPFFYLTLYTARLQLLHPTPNTDLHIFIQHISITLLVNIDFLDKGGTIWILLCAQEMEGVWTYIQCTTCCC